MLKKRALLLSGLAATAAWGLFKWLIDPSPERERLLGPDEEWQATDGYISRDFIAVPMKKAAPRDTELYIWDISGAPLIKVVSNNPLGGINGPFLSPSGELIFVQYIIGDRKFFSRVCYVDLRSASPQVTTLIESDKVILCPALIGDDNRGGRPDFLYFTGDFDFSAEYNPMPVRNLALMRDGVGKTYKAVSFPMAGGFCQKGPGEIYLMSKSVEYPFDTHLPRLGDGIHTRLYKFTFSGGRSIVEDIPLDIYSKMDIFAIQSGACGDKIFAKTLPLGDYRPNTLVEIDLANRNAELVTELPDAVQYSQPFVINRSSSSTRIALVGTPNLRSTEPIGALILLTVDLPEKQINQVSLSAQHEFPVIKV